MFQGFSASEAVDLREARVGESHQAAAAAQERGTTQGIETVSCGSSPINTFSLILCPAWCGCLAAGDFLNCAEVFTVGVTDSRGLPSSFRARSARHDRSW